MCRALSPKLQGQVAEIRGLLAGRTGGLRVPKGPSRGWGRGCSLAQGRDLGFRVKGFGFRGGGVKGFGSRRVVVLLNLTIWPKAPKQQTQAVELTP